MIASKRRAVSGKTAAAFVAVLIAIAVSAVLINQNIKANSIYVNNSAIILGVGQEYNLPVESNAFLKINSALQKTALALTKYKENVASPRAVMIQS